MRISLVVNPVAGNRAYRFVSSIESLLRDNASLSTFITSKKGDAREYVKGLEDTDRIVVASGDGTINEVFNGICGSHNRGLRDVPVALMPLGITNVLAKEAGIPEDVEKAVDIALNGKPEKISLGRINGTYFVLMAGIGFDGETIRGLKNNFIKRISGKGAHIVSALKVFRTYNPPLIRVGLPGNETTGYTALVSNVRCYGGYYYVTPRASITEPVLDVCVFRGRTRGALLRFIIGVLRNRHLSYPDVYYAKTTEVHFSSENTVHVQIDGDYFGTLPVKIEIEGDAATLVVPPAG